MKRLFTRLRLRISTRLTMWYGLTLLILLSLFAVFCYLFFHASLHRDFDRHLSHEKRQLLPYIQFDEGAPAFASLDNLRSVAYETDGVYGTYVRLLAPDGNVLYRSPNFENHHHLAVRVPSTPEVRTISRSWEGEIARTAYTPLMDNDARLRGWLEVTGFEWSLHQELNRLRLAMFVGIIFSVVLAIGGGYLLARRALQPMATITEAANEIRATDLSTRLPTSFGVRDELTDLAERRLGEVVENLVDNAVKYSLEGGTILVEVARKGGDAVLVVSDTGIGFSEAHCERLFDRFYRADTSEVQARHGSGLGLAIVKAIAQAYGGTVDAYSAGPMQGSRFTVRLPIWVSGDV